MGVKVLCLICAAVVLMMALFGIRAQAEALNPPLSAQVAQVRLSKRNVVRSTTPLASAMLLISGGLGIGLLFDKKNKR